MATDVQSMPLTRADISFQNVYYSLWILMFLRCYVMVLRTHSIKDQKCNRNQKHILTADHEMFNLNEVMCKRFGSIEGSVVPNQTKDLVSGSSSPSPSGV